MNTQEQEAIDYEASFCRADLFAGFDRGDADKDFDDEQLAYNEAFDDEWSAA
jgi:hypothetical protein